MNAKIKYEQSSAQFVAAGAQEAMRFGRCHCCNIQYASNVVVTITSAVANVLSSGQVL